jgi:hypothetical protein
MQELKKTDNEIAMSLVQIVAESNEKFMDMCRKLDNKKEVIKTIRDLEFRNYESGSMIEMYIEANFKINKFVCWFIDCSFKEQTWIIDSRVCLTDDSGQSVIEEYPELHTISVEHFINNLKKSVSLIESSIDNFDFSSL